MTTTDKTAAEIIREARNVLFERGWHQGGVLAEDGSVCLYGALLAAEGQEIRRDAWAHEDARGAVDLALPSSACCTIASWNDEPNRTFDEVIDVLDRAEKIAEEHGSADG